MGGIGSGQYVRWSSGKAIGEQMYRIDIRQLRKHRRLMPGQQFSWSWSQRGEPSGNIMIRMALADNRPLSMQLDYRTRQGDGNWRHMLETVRLDWQPCRFGGWRAWIHCPVCSRTVAVLYGGTRFLCRHCQQLTYASQREDVIDRAQRRGEIAMEKLGCRNGFVGGFVSKPKWMRWTTFERLAQKVEAANRDWQFGIQQRCGGSMELALDGPVVDRRKSRIRRWNNQ